MQLVQTKQPNTEALIIRPLATLQRHAGRNLQPGSGKFAAIFQRLIIGIADHNAGGFKPVSSDRGKTAFFQQPADRGAKLYLFLTHRFKPVIFGFDQRVTKQFQRIGWHGGVIGMPAIFIGFHDRQPFFDIADIAG